jgi:hypothetical protein
VVWLGRCVWVNEMGVRSLRWPRESRVAKGRPAPLLRPPESDVSVGPAAPASIGKLFVILLSQHRHGLMQTVQSLCNLVQTFFNRG